MSLLYIIGVLLLVFAGFTGLEAIRFVRWRDYRRSWVWLGITLTLSAGASGCFWFGPLFPISSTVASRGFGPDWSCRRYGEGARVCIRNVRSAGEQGPQTRAPD